MLGPAVATIAAIEAAEALKILAGRGTVSPYLLKLDLWSNVVQRIDTASARPDDCPCCRLRQFEYLHQRHRTQ